MSFWDFSLSDLAVPVAIGASAYLSSQAAKDAANAQAGAAQASGDTQKEMFYKSREDLLPFTETGQQSLFGLADIYGIPRPDGQGGYTTGKAFQGTPGYQFRLGEGLKAIDHAASANGNMFSGRRLKALSDYGQNTASQEWGNYTNVLQSMAGLGQSSGATTLAGSNQAGANIGNATQNYGTARASGYTGAAGALNQGVGNALYYYRPQR